MIKYILAYVIALLGSFIVNKMYLNSIDNKFIIAYIGGAVILKLIDIALDTDKNKMIGDKINE